MTVSIENEQGNDQPQDEATSGVEEAAATASVTEVAQEPPAVASSKQAEERAASDADDAADTKSAASEDTDEADTEADDAQTPPAERKMRWYVVQAYSGYEAKVKASLEQRIQEADVEDLFGEILIPRENVTETRGTARRVTSRTFYPGYIFVQMRLTDHTWHLVKDTPRVSGFVGGRHPTAVPRSQIAAVAQQVAEGAAKPKPRVVFEQGDHVRVIEGAFANFTGTIEEVKPEKQKVRVLVSIFGRATPVELDYGQVEKTV